MPVIKFVFLKTMPKIDKFDQSMRSLSFLIFHKIKFKCGTKNCFSGVFRKTSKIENWKVQSGFYGKNRPKKMERIDCNFE
jgi:hypothetical protein